MTDLVLRSDAGGISTLTFDRAGMPEGGIVRRYLEHLVVLPQDILLEDGPIN